MRKIELLGEPLKDYWLAIRYPLLAIILVDIISQVLLIFLKQDFIQFFSILLLVIFAIFGILFGNRAYDRIGGLKDDKLSFGHTGFAGVIFGLLSVFVITIIEGLFSFLLQYIWLGRVVKFLPSTYILFFPSLTVYNPTIILELLSFLKLGPVETLIIEFIITQIVNSEFARLFMYAVLTFCLILGSSGLGTYLLGALLKYKKILELHIVKISPY